MHPAAPAFALAMLLLAGCAPATPGQQHHDIPGGGTMTVTYEGQAQHVSWHWATDSGTLHFTATTSDGTTEKVRIDQTTMQGTGNMDCGVRCTLTWRNPGTTSIGVWESTTAGGTTFGP